VSSSHLLYLCMFLLYFLYTLVPILLSLLSSTSKIYSLSLHDALPISNKAMTCRACGTPCFEPASRRVSQASGRRTRRPFSICRLDRKSTRLNSSHVSISYAVFCLKKKKCTQKATFTIHTALDSKL